MFTLCPVDASCYFIHNFKLSHHMYYFSFSLSEFSITETDNLQGSREREGAIFVPVSLLSYIVFLIKAHVITRLDELYEPVGIASD